MPKQNRLHFEKISPHLDFPKTEEEVLKYWDEIDAFKRSVEERPEDKPFVFYDGPPFATGTPHYGHLLGSVMKDIVPRYWTMKGYRVERRWGWDCHGLPIENIIEKELNLKGGKKGIEAYGIANFNQACRAAILRFDSEWEKVIKRIGRWVDMENSYKTMDLNFMESVWWAFGELYKKGLVYQGRKVILYCPRCSTPLSNFEIAMDNSYQDVEDYSLTLKFPLKGKPNEYLLAWTTTPWTLIGNVALAVNPKATYLKVKQGDEFVYLASERQSMLMGDYQIDSEMPGDALVGKEYEPLYPFLKLDGKKAFYVAKADFVSLEEGVGIVHTAAMYGEDDYRLAQEIKLPLVEMLNDQGKFLDFVTPLAGVFYKKSESWIVDDLTKRHLIYQRSKITHSYPFCYRCQTPLYYNAVPAWFINIQKIKPELVKQNETINWYPKHLKHGRFGKGLAEAPDWNISRSRYWGTPMPIWQGEKTGKLRVISSLAELVKWAVNPKAAQKLTDIHREFLDDLEVWVDDAKTEKGIRIKEVFDCWVESGSMSFAEHHYPFDHKQKFESRFPAQYIVEYIAQTRAWFYTLHVMAVALFGKPAFENALTTGTIMAEDGSKMSKSKQNYPDPMEVINQFGVDSLRFYFASSPLMKTAQNVNFNQKSIDEIRKRIFLIFWNVFAFYKLYDNEHTGYVYPQKINHVLDRWLISRLENITKIVSTSLDKYDVVTASRTLMDFIGEISQWWLRLSRDRLRDSSGNQEVLQVFHAALHRLTLLFAPFAPFFSEVIYQNLLGDQKDSIHLEAWPPANLTLIDPELEHNMAEIQSIVEKAHSSRKEHQLKARQPLAQLSVISTLTKPDVAFLELIKQEVNIKKIDWRQGKELSVSLDFTLTPSLKAEGEAREIMRQIMDVRKKQSLPVSSWIQVEIPFWPKAWESEIKHKVKAKSLQEGPALKVTSVV